MVAEGSALVSAVSAFHIVDLMATSTLAAASDMGGAADDGRSTGNLLLLSGFLLALLSISFLAVGQGQNRWKYVCSLFGVIALLSGCGLVAFELDLVHAGNSPLTVPLQCTAGVSALLSVLALWPALTGAPGFGAQEEDVPDHEPALPLRAAPGGPLSLEDALRGTGISIFAQGADLAERWATPLQDPAPAPQLTAALRERMAATAQSALSRNEAVAADFQLQDTQGNPRWYEVAARPGMLADGVRGVIGCLFDVTRFRKAEADCRSLLQETTHRAKNMLSVIQSVVRMSAKNLNLPPAAVEPFTARLQSVALAYDLLAREEWEGVTLAELVRTQLNHALGNAASRASLSGPPLRLRPAAVQTLALAIHELAMKAGSQGALSTPEGRVEIRWEESALRDGSTGYRLVWQESGIPLPEPVPERKSFSRDVLERLTPRGLRGEVASSYSPDGIYLWEIRFPASNVLSTH